MKIHHISIYTLILAEISMNLQIEQLYKLASKPSRIIIGLMSGTSLDGLDIACCRFTGSGGGTQTEILNFRCIRYSAAEQAVIRQVFARADAPLQEVCILNAWLGRLHASMVNQSLKDWGYEYSEIDLIASHGQTIFHAPSAERFTKDTGLRQVANDSFPFRIPDSTLQIGDADHIASICKIITISDFRQKHIAAGGQGAPLAVYGDFLLLNKPGIRRYLINIGGITNFSLLPGTDRGEIFASDTGPGNTLSDALMRNYMPGETYDYNGERALSGQVIPELLKQLKLHPFFASSYPKTTGPEMFSLAYFVAALAQSGIIDPKLEDLLATVCQLVADSLFNALIENGADAGAEFYASGGGVYNQAIMSKICNKAAWLKSLSGTEVLGLPADAKEAALFAVLANEAVAGDISRYGALFSKMPAVSFGKISMPR